MSLFNDDVQNMPNGPDKDAIAILDHARDKVNSMAAWNTLFDAQVYLVNRAEYRRAYGTGTLLTERLRKCLDAGDVSALFGLLWDWSPEELAQLLADIDALSEAKDSEIVEAWKCDIFQPETFFSNRKSALVTEARDQARMTVLAVCSEIASVAMFYLEKRKRDEDGNLCSSTGRDCQG